MMAASTEAAITLIRSWIDSANDPDGPFPVNNLPYGVFSAGDAPRCCVAIGDYLVDLAALERAGLLPVVGFDAPALNDFMGQGAIAWADIRQRLQALL